MPSKIDINKIAQLARLELTDEESNRLGKHLEQIIEYIDLLNKLDTSNVEPMSHMLPLHNVFREDKVSRPAEVDYLAGSPAHNKGHYEVPKII